jgi:hypothetical protein
LGKKAVATQAEAAGIYFSDFVGLTRADVEGYGAFDISMINDLPLFIDPFLLFHGGTKEYKVLHDEMINYVAFLRDKSAAGTISDGLLKAWFTFPEVKQNWFGYSMEGNQGRGLGMDFARKFNNNLEKIFKDFGNEKVTRGTHIEKVLLTNDVGRDNVSDLVTNMIKHYLCEFTEQFAKTHLQPQQRKRVRVPKVRFDYKTETWEPGFYELPWINGDYVILTPIDLLTKDEIWINSGDLIRDYPQIMESIPNEQMRDLISNYFAKALDEIMQRDKAAKQARQRQRSRKKHRNPPQPPQPNQSQKNEAARLTIGQFPGMIDFYIRHKEDTGDVAEQQAEERVRATERLYIAQVRELSHLLATGSGFYQLEGSDSGATIKRLGYLKQVIEDHGGWKALYTGQEQITKEADLRVILRLVWLGDPDAREAASTAGPKLYKLGDLVQFKLATNPKLLSTLAEQKTTADGFKTCIVCFSRLDLASMKRAIEAHDLVENEDVVLIDARRRATSPS